MHKLDDKIFEEFFYYGIDNQSEVIDGIIFFATKEEHEKYESLGEQFKVGPEVQLENIKELAYRYALQYYRFIYLNNNPNKLIDYKTDNEQQITKEIVDTSINRLLQENKIQMYKVGPYHNADEQNKFSATYIKNHVIRKFWAIEISEQLKQLDIQEREDPIEYYETWLNTRLNTALNRKNDEEIQIIKSTIEQFKSRKNKMSKNIEDEERE